MSTTQIIGEGLENDLTTPRCCGFRSVGKGYCGQEMTTT